MSDITLCKQLGVEIDMIFVIELEGVHYWECDNGEWNIWKFEDDKIIYREEKYEDPRDFLGG